MPQIGGGADSDSSRAVNILPDVTLPAGIDPRTPVVVGVGQILDRTGGPEPVSLMIDAITAAERDAGATGLARRAQVIGVVPVVSWRYYDPARLIATALGASPTQRWYPAMGGNTPQLLLNRLATAISNGEAEVGIVCGGEAYRTRMAHRRQDGARPEWTRQDQSELPTWGDAQKLDMGHPAELAHSILLPTQCYPLLESALLHASGRTVAEHTAFLGELWSGFSAVASTNPYAWDQVTHSAEEITTVTPGNRIVGFPYTKFMVSNPDVDMASAALVCSAEAADRAGIARDRWVFIWSGTDGTDPYLSERPSMTGSASMRIAGRAALELAGVGVDDLAHLDIYSCFPSAVEIGCAELGIGLDRQLTVTGGLCFAGGPWNNPVGHAVATMTEVLRADPGSVGLVTANGGILQKHAYGVYSSEPPTSGCFRWAHPQFAIDAAEPLVQVAEGYAGPGTLETWTVMHERDGSPSRAHGSVRTPDGARAWAVSSDPEVMERFEREDVSGAAVHVDEDGTMRLVDGG